MNATVKVNGFNRQFQTLLLTLSFLKDRWGERIQSWGDLFFHLTVFSRRGGYINFQVEEGEADGFVRYLARGDDGKMHLYVLGFRIGNRWLARRDAKPNTHLLWEIKTAASVEHGLSVHTVVWGAYIHNRVELAPFDMSRLPSDEVIAKKHEAIRKVQDWMAHHFPAREVELAPLPSFLIRTRR